jgi:radical SAM superfamily enzyme YgiQ (UPF0313 family)/MoaA/NifB/PqqE/SkfB family radical SAM enzyme
MKIALVQCPGWGRECPPYSLACLSSFVRQSGHEAAVFDLNNEFYHSSPDYRKMWADKDYYSFWENRGQVAALIADNRAVVDRFVRRILESGARVAGFTTHTTSFLISLAIAERIKKEDPGVSILFGGPQASRSQCAKDFSEDRRVDGVCVGEGERILVSVLDSLSRGESLKPLPGLIVREGGRPVDLGDAELIADIDSLPFPDYSDFKEDILGGRYANPKRLEIFDSRGCVRSCDFCSEWQYWRRYRFMTGRRIFDEVVHQTRLYPGVSHFYFIGSLLNGNPKELERFCDLVIDAGLKITWEGQAIVSPRMDEALLAKMARAGCVWLGYGIESGSEALRRRINKNFTNENAEKTLKATARAGIKAQINIMFGMPTETKEEFGETLKFLTRVRPYIDTVLASQSFCVLDKGTIFHTHPERYGIKGEGHHLFWESNGGDNSYPERFRRYEEFCRLALLLKIPETSGVLSLKPDKWFLLGSYHAHKKDFARALMCYRRSVRKESRNKGVLAEIARCYAALGRPGKARDYYESARAMAVEGMPDSLDKEVRRELAALPAEPEPPAPSFPLERGGSDRSSSAWRRMNIALNEKEFREGSPKLFSTPKLVTLGVHNACNAKCVFCLEGAYSRFSMDIYRNFFEARMGHFIRGAEKVTFTGFGEILWVPGIEEFLDYLNETLPETDKIFTTNGTPLRPGVVERILKGRYVIQVSLHASRPGLHEELTQLKGQFDAVVSNIRDLTAARDRLGRGKFLHIELVNILMRQNVGDLCDFLRLAWDMRVQSVRAQYVTMFTPEHIGMSCFFDQERTNRAVAAAAELIPRLQASESDRPFHVSLPPLFGSRSQASPTICYDPWQHVYVELQGSVLPCCFWGEHIGNLAKGDDMDALWNGPFYQGLRSSMASGEPHPWCRSCVRWAGLNVDSVLGHVTNRPAAQRIVLEEIGRRGLPCGDDEARAQVAGILREEAAAA